MESSDNERCLLVIELAQILEMVRQLEDQIDQSSTNEFCKALARKIHLSIDKSIHMAKSFCPEARPESPVQSADGSPRSSDISDQPDRCHNNAGREMCKKRKTLPKLINQVRVSSVADVGPLDDGSSWRKYGQKDILGAKYPRAYFRCTHRNTQGCLATKQVQRTDENPLVFDVIYYGNHTCHKRNQFSNKSSSAVTEKLQRNKDQSLASETKEWNSLTFSFPSTPVGADCNVISSCFLGSFASPFVSPATSESNYSVTAPCQVSSYENGLRIQTGETELASADTATTNSQMAEMDLMLGFDGDFNLDVSGLF